MVRLSSPEWEVELVMEQWMRRESALMGEMGIYSLLSMIIKLCNANEEKAG